MSEKLMEKARSPNYSKTYATNLLVSETDTDVRIYGFNEIITTNKGAEVAISDGEMILTREAAMILFEQMEQLVAEWRTLNRAPVISDTRKSTLERLSNRSK